LERPNLAAQALQQKNAWGIAATGAEFVSRLGGRTHAVNQEEDMHTLADEIQSQIDAGRRTIERSFDDVKEMDMPEVPPAVIAAGVVAAVVGLGIIGWMLFRRRRRPTIVERLTEAIPGPVRDLPTELQSRVRRAK
jgi:hypothetical protein